MRAIRPQLDLSIRCRITNTTAIRRALSIFVFLLLLSGLSGPLFAYAGESAWVSRAHMQEARSGLGVAVANGKIYAIGGATSTGFTSTNEEYDPATNTWTFKAPMPTSRSAFGVAVYENKIYCIGGYVRGGATAVNEVYDPATNAWASLASMPTARLNLRANAVNGKIYLIGGIPTPDIGRTLNEVYDPTTNTWTTKTPIPVAVDLYASAVANDKIFVMKSGTNQVYDAENDSWSAGVPPPSNSMIPSAVTMSSGNSSTRIYLFGTNAQGAYWMLNAGGFTTQCYDPATRTWTAGTPIPTGSYDSGVAAIEGKIYVIGGYSYGERSGLSLNAPVIYNVAIEMYTPRLDVDRPASSQQPTQSPTATTPAPEQTPTLTPTPISTLTPTTSPTTNPTSTPTSTQTPSPTLTPSESQTTSPSPSPPASTSSKLGTSFEDAPASKSSTFLMFCGSILTAIAVFLVLLVAKKRL